VTSKPDFKVVVLLLVFMHLTRYLFAIAEFLLHFESLVLCYALHKQILKLFAHVLGINITP